MTLFRDYDFQGPSKFFPVGDYDFATFTQFFANDSVSSVKVHGNVRATLYEVCVFACGGLWREWHGGGMRSLLRCGAAG